MAPTQTKLQWRDGQPISAMYGDIYFSRASGIAETRHVFLQHNRLAERWPDLRQPIFTIAETGFGTGLNFLCAWQLWNERAPEDARLHFVSTEKYPLARDDLAQALALWPELAGFSAQLLEQYHRLAPGWQRMEFDGGRITLTLLIGDARETLPQLRASVDAWFLDGFAPAKNPEMWQPELFAQISRLAAPACTFATFTSAGAVRRGLEAVGFTVEKVAGFGSKREMLRGEFSSPIPTPALPLKGREEARGQTCTLPPSRGEQEGGWVKTAIVIGGGIAGAASAWSLARRGWQVSLIERHGDLAQEASGNPQGVLYPRLSGHDIPLSRVAQIGFVTTLRLLRQLPRKGEDWDDCGLLQQAFNSREAKRCAEVLARELPQDLVRAVDAGEAGELAGIAMPHGGLWFPGGGWVHPPALCRALAARPGITLKTSARALRLSHDGHGWQVHDADGLLAEAPLVIVCAANDSAAFAQTAHLPLEPVRGQITQLPATPASARLKAVVCTEGYISPARNGTHCLGATFAPDERSLELRAADHADNLAMLRHLSAELYQALGGGTLDAGHLAGRVALRCVAPDYLPMAGQVLDATLLEQGYAIGSQRGPEHLPWLDGLYVNTGHGSKGLLTAPLCAEFIAGLIEHEPLPLDLQLAGALNPNRFLLRRRGLRKLVGAICP